MDLNRFLFLTAEPVVIFFDMLVYVVNSSVAYFEVCVNLRTVEVMATLGERVIYVAVDPVDGDAIGESDNVQRMDCL